MNACKQFVVTHTHTPMFANSDTDVAACNFVFKNSDNTKAACDVCLCTLTLTCVLSHTASFNIQAKQMLQLHASTKIRDIWHKTGVSYPENETMPCWCQVIIPLDWLMWFRALRGMIHYGYFSFSSIYPETSVRRKLILSGRMQNDQNYLLTPENFWRFE